METRFWLSRRGRNFYAMDSESGRRLSLRTSVRKDAERILHAKNGAGRKPRLGRALAKAYLEAYDPRVEFRVRQDVMDEFSHRGQETTRSLRRGWRAQRLQRLLQAHAYVTT